MSCRAVEDGRVMAESSDKMWPTGEGDGKPLQYSCLENLMNTIKRQKDMTPEDEPPRLAGVQRLLGKEHFQWYPDKIKDIRRKENKDQCLS